MSAEDDVLTLSNPRLLSAIYFGLLAIIATIFIDLVFYFIGVEQVIPLFKAILLATFIAAVFGAGFGERIVHHQKPYRGAVFWLGFAMVLLAVPVYDLGLSYFIIEHHPSLFSDAGWLEYGHFYLMVLMYSYIIFGLWLALFAGLAAIYLRSRLAYYLLRTTSERKRN